MTVYNLGSINADLFYQVPHLIAPGETLASTKHSKGLGGKGANMSVAAARGAARVVHIGVVGKDGRWAVDRLPLTRRTAVARAPRREYSKSSCCCRCRLHFRYL